MSGSLETIVEILNKTGKRAESFAMMINHIHEIKNPLIVETGCARLDNNYEGDGMSTLIFDTYVREFGGEFHSVDISEDNTNFVKNQVSNSSIHCSDSVKFLWNFIPNKKIDLLYLDSFDFDMSNPHPSSMHHIFELAAVMPKLGPGTMVAVDDNFGHIGKGGYVKEFFDLLGKERIYSGYQWIWML